MPTKTKASPAIRGSRKGSRFTCPRCGFKAKHAMGLGRHMSARHGTPSKRSIAARNVSVDGRGIRAIERRIATLENRVDRLLKTLRKAGR